MHVVAPAAPESSTANPAAADWARIQAARTLVRAAMGSAGVVYRPIWPMAIDERLEVGQIPRIHCEGWLASTLDLRDGLSVIEVFAAQDAAGVFDGRVS